MEHFDYISWIVIPLLIFTARLIDVPLGTLRQILMFRGMRTIVPVIAFVEVLLWLVAITQVMQRVTNIAGYLAWALGFSVGTHLGMVIDDKLALGHQLVRIITREPAPDLKQVLKDHNYGVTSADARGSKGPVEVLFIVTKRNRLMHLLKLLNSCAPKLFYTIEDVRQVNSGIFSKPLSPIPGADKRK